MPYTHDTMGHYQLTLHRQKGVKMRLPTRVITLAILSLHSWQQTRSSGLNWTQSRLVSPLLWAQSSQLTPSCRSRPPDSIRQHALRHLSPPDLTTLLAVSAIFVLWPIRY
jgi:hypothetical protein